MRQVGNMETLRTRRLQSMKGIFRVLRSSILSCSEKGWVWRCGRAHRQAFELSHRVTRLKRSRNYWDWALGGALQASKVIPWDGLIPLSNWRISLPGNNDHGEPAWSGSLQGLLYHPRNLKVIVDLVMIFPYPALTCLSDLDLFLVKIRRMMAYKTSL